MWGKKELKYGASPFCLWLAQHPIYIKILNSVLLYMTLVLFHAKNVPEGFKSSLQSFYVNDSIRSLFSKELCRTQMSVVSNTGDSETEKDGSMKNSW